MLKIIIVAIKGVSLSFLAILLLNSCGGLSDEESQNSNTLNFPSSPSPENMGLYSPEDSKNSTTSPRQNLGTQSATNLLPELPLPDAIAKLYSTHPDPKVSDSFNGDELDKSIDGWNYRSDSKFKFGDPQALIQLVDNQYISIKGDGHWNEGSGITSKNTSQYGFYMTKWRVSGIRDKQPSCWHPSIWAAKCNFSTPSQCINTGDARLEIDFMEGFQSETAPYWVTKNITWKTTSDGVFANDQSFYPADKQWPTKENGKWQTMGYEYTPDYTRLWFFENDKWQHIHTIPWTESGTINNKRINYAYRKPLYWIFSMARPNCNYGGSADASLDIDYFHHYPYTYTSSFRSENKLYTFINRGSGRALTNTEVNLDSYVSTHDRQAHWVSQRWMIANESASPFEYYTLQNFYSQLFLRGYDPNQRKNQAGNGANVTVRTLAEYPTLKWRLIPSHLKDYYYIESKHSGRYLRGFDPYSENKNGNGAHVTINELKPWATMLWKPLAIE